MTLNEKIHFNFKSNSKNNFFAPEWNCHIFEKQTNINTITLSNFLLKIKKNILKLPVTKKINTVDGYTGLGIKSTTARYANYNLLNFENIEINLLKNEIKIFHNEICKFFNLKLPKKMYIQCWVNFLKKGEKIKPHAHSVHPDTYLGGHFCVNCVNTETIYINPINQINDPELYKSKNINGKLTIFQNFIPHYTTINNDVNDRITIAFDISLKKTSNNQLLINL